MRDFQVYVEDIVDAINSIEAYTKGLTYEGFVKDKKMLMQSLGTLRLLVKQLSIFLYQ